MICPIRKKKYLAAFCLRLGGQEDGLDDILDITEADLPAKARFDPFGNPFEQGVKIPIPWPIDPGRPQNDERNFMSMDKGQLLSHPFALAVG
jgi:hypothetical protein